MTHAERWAPCIGFLRLGDLGGAISEPVECLLHMQLGNYLNPKSRQINGPRPLKIAKTAIILHTFGGPGRSNQALRTVALLKEDMKVCSETARLRGHTPREVQHLCRGRQHGRSGQKEDDFSSGPVSGAFARETTEESE